MKHQNEWGLLHRITQAVSIPRLLTIPLVLSILTSDVGAQVGVQDSQTQKKTMKSLAFYYCTTGGMQDEGGLPPADENFQKEVTDYDGKPALLFTGKSKDVSSNIPGSPLFIQGKSAENFNEDVEQF